MTKYLTWLIIGGVALAAGVWFGNQRLQADPAASANASNTSTSSALPKWTGFTFEDSKGQTYALKQLEGKAVVINFWATWCPPCVEEMPDLDRLYPALLAKNIEMVGIGIDTAANIRDFTSKRSFSYPLLIAGAQGSDLARLLGNSSGSLPYTVVLDAKGQVIFSKLGRVTPEELTRATLQQQP